MKKQRMTADNVEQLMEIVRALQTGEDPAVALERKKAECAQVADTPKSDPKPVSKSDLKPASKAVSRSRAERKTESETETPRKKMPISKPVVLKQAVSKSAVSKTAESSGESYVILDHISDGLWHMVQMVDRRINPLLLKAQKRIYRQEEQNDQELALEAESEREGNEAPKAAEVETEQEPKQPEKLVEAETENETEKETENEPKLAETTIAAEAEEEPDLKEERDLEDDLDLEEDLEEEQEAKAAPKKKLTEKVKKTKSEKEMDQTGHNSLGGSRIRTYLEEKGIYRKEIFMILMVVVLLAAIIGFAVSGVRNYQEEKRKKEHVTADKGLTVTVEKEPEQWSTQAEVQLRFRTTKLPVTQIVINGEILQPDADGYVTFTADTHLLEAEASTEEGTLHAQIELPKLDSEPPVIYAQKNQNQIVLTGTDTRSGVRTIRYAQIRKTDFIQLPIYQEYTGPISYEEGSMYYFYAADEAGNAGVPVATSMQTAESIEFEQTKLSLYPGQNADLVLKTTPENALLNNMRYESMNPEIVSVGASGMVTALMEGNATVKVSADGVTAAVCEVEVSRTRTVTISAIGDCTLGTDEAFNTTTNFDAYAAMNDDAYFFANVRAILENDDATFANLEGTLTTANTREAKTYAFKGSPSYTEILKEGSIEVVTLANNHSSDYGAQSYADTVCALQEAGIAYCDGDEIVVQDVNGVKTAFIGIYVLRDGIAKEEQVKTTIAAAKEAGAQLVIVAFHWGSEKVTQADSTQRSLAHTAVDCGADLVVGHHPHVLQGIELYNGTYIVYSLGNFCLGGNTAPSDTDTMIFKQTFTFTDGVLQNDDQIEIIPCSVTSAVGYNNYQPTPAEGTERERIMGQINEYSQEFGQSYIASDGLF